MDERWEQAAPRGETHVRVYFAHTDHMGVVYHGRYLTWMEVGRTELMRDRDITYAEVEQRGISLPVTEAFLRVRRPARYDDLVRVETRLGGLRTREVEFLYRMFRDDDLLTEGRTVHIPVDKETGRGTRVPTWLAACFA